MYVQQKRVLNGLSYQKFVYLEVIYLSLRTKRIRFKVTPMAFATAITISPFTIQFRRVPVRKGQQ